jgi:hypothetical protein
MSVRNRVTHADELPYDGTTSGLAATDVQAAIDEVSTAGGGDLVVLSDDPPDTPEVGTLWVSATGQCINPDGSFV